MVVDGIAKSVSITKRVDPDKLDSTKSIYDNPAQYLLDSPVTTDITDTETGQALLQLSTCYPDSTIEIECENGLGGQLTAQVLVLGR